MNYYCLSFLIISCLSSSCSRIPCVDDGLVSSTVANRIGVETEWRQGCCQDEHVACFIENSIATELTADNAIQIALLNNPKVQAVFENLGISQADLLEAGLLTNPSFELEVRYPFRNGLHTNIEYLITSSLLDIFLIPLRTQLASTEFEQVKLRVSDEILDLAFEVRETYYSLMTEEKKLVYLQSIVDLSGIISDLMSKQIAVGNVNSLEYQMVQARLLEAEVELQQSQAEIVFLREKLTRLLGFSESVCLLLPKPCLEGLEYASYDLCTLESIALENRLDLQVARFEVVRICQMLGLKDWWTYTNLKGGLAGERDADGPNLLGPGFAFDLPIFNYGQAARLRLMAQLRQAQDRLDELEIRVLSEVREAYNLLSGYGKITQNYQNRLLPVQSQIVASANEYYNVMGLGVDRLLENKRLEIIAHKNFTESAKNFLLARVKLDRALGGYLGCEANP